ncbi:hypothetical protein IFM89_008784 [Coptis chinensis]|uniref:RNase H type-1 domain-containing protein n=1 Tax=Coptis chinensis TaxID=261450 RepID=A0A835LE15_9MAGN|nr:hypothetical protein IFM89_008784 [Coptis chinensis]
MDGAARGNPGPSSYGIVIRNHTGGILKVVCKNLGHNTNYWAESLALGEVMELAVEEEWHNVWIESDAAAVVTAAKEGPMHWKLKGS